MACSNSFASISLSQRTPLFLMRDPLVLKSFATATWSSPIPTNRILKSNSPSFFIARPSIPIYSAGTYPIRSISRSTISFVVGDWTRPAETPRRIRR